ncbi:hypothetical protein D6D01_06364 [Aureobasidium pullulans]|uniref:Mitochondrial carrier n=1 Tax=Aureobasidium pullulans TaxID=5580 RepID=A0A4S9KYU4_AURPU|nr:hypothetical protein D6D01_06364 [Aureobasidium pullulans]
MLSRSSIARRAFVSAPIRSFQTAPVLRVGKESALHEEGRAEEVERVKNEQIQKQKEGKGHWHEEIASDSESIVKADRGDISADADTIKQLQKETEKLASQKK